MPPKTPKAPKTRAAAPDPPAPAPAPVLYVRGVAPDIIAALDAMVTARRAELGAAATDNATRRAAASLSRNDVLVDIITDAVKARAAVTSSGSSGT